MKTLFLGCALALAGAANAQVSAPISALPPAQTGGRVVYALVIESPGVSQADLYGKALRWLSAVPQIGPVTLVHDAASGTLAGRVGAAVVSRAGLGALPCTLWRQISVEVKDGRTRYEARDFAVQYYVASPAAMSAPTAAQVLLHPLEEFTDPAASRYYARDGQPRAWTASLLGAADQQTSAQVADLRRALLTPAW